MGAQVESAELDFLAELKQQFERAIDLRKNLDNKANTMITIAGAISTLLLAIATFLITKIEPTNEVYLGAIGIFSAGLILAIFSMIYFIKSYMVKDYYHPIEPSHFFENGEYIQEKVDEFRDAKPHVFVKHMIKEYLESLRNFQELNSKKANDIKWGQILLVACTGSVGILLGFILISTALGLITLS